MRRCPPVHPRVRGERIIAWATLGGLHGSSPRARGTLRRDGERRRRARFIPACAGNARRRRRSGPTSSVHPRVRGERAPGAVGGEGWSGSSPRARGTRVGEVRDEPGDRFIPACAGNARGTGSGSTCRSVHPRVRGERCSAALIRASSCGSSPRARGTRSAGGRHVRARRFIPACAGNARSRACTSRKPPVHPRVRGERCSRWNVATPTAGSSPRARGTRHRPRRPPHRRRFIPACAGNANSSRPAAPRCPVHPRVRGERRADGIPGGVPAGSSPRARGTPTRRPGRRSACRFIPACAGNARSRARARPRRPVHPRVRGERAGEPPGPPFRHGSSPRARGTRAAVKLHRVGRRFIPACAGNASKSRCWTSSATVHPRVRGERVTPGLPDLLVFGSSPRARGTRRRRGVARGGGRFIPACAGNAAPHRCPGARRPVHPRVRGERLTECSIRAYNDGSSPRARGTLEPRHLGLDARRFIPACAGNAPWSPPGS